MNITITLNEPIAEQFVNECFERIIQGHCSRYGISKDCHSARFENVNDEDFENIRRYAMFLNAPVITLR